MKDIKNHWLVTFFGTVTASFFCGYYFGHSISKNTMDNLVLEVENLEKKILLLEGENNPLKTKIQLFDDKQSYETVLHLKKTIEVLEEENKRLGSLKEKEDYPKELVLQNRETKIVDYNKVDISSHEQVVDLGSKKQGKMTLKLLDIEILNNSLFKINYLLTVGNEEMRSIVISKETLELVDDNFSTYIFQDFERIPVDKYRGESTKIAGKSFVKGAIIFKGDLKKINLFTKLDFKMHYAIGFGGYDHFFSFQNIKVK